MKRRAFLIGAPLVVAGCTGQQVWAPDDVVAKAIAPGSPTKQLKLFTMKNVGSGNGAHTALLIDASQRVIFDPAGSWNQERMPERNDVLFGATEALEDYYISFHARVTYFVVSQRIAVSPEVAEQALNLALRAGPVPKANCTRVTSGLLQSLPGFESLRRTWFPNNLSDAFAKLPGVTTIEYREQDADDKTVAAREIAEALKEEQ